MSETGSERRRNRPAPPCVVRFVEAEKYAALWRHPSAGFTPVQGFRRVLGAEEKFAAPKLDQHLLLAVAAGCDPYLQGLLSLLEQQVALVNRLARVDELPDAFITTESGLKITPLDTVALETAQALIDQMAMMLPHLEITELLLEVDEWTDFTQHFTHLKSGDAAKDRTFRCPQSWPTQSTSA